MERQFKLGDLFQIGSSKRVLKAQWQKSGIPFYRGREVTKLSQNGFVENELFITQELFDELSDKHGVPSAGDIVITAIGTIGNSYIVQGKDRFYFKDASVLWLKKTSNVNSQYINLWLKSPLMKSQLDQGNGATVDTLTIKKLQTLIVDLPELEEQKCIVAILDQAFADIEQARAKTEQNLKNARELFESYLQQVFSQRGEGWTETKLGDLAEFKNGLNFSQSSKGEVLKVVGVRDFAGNFLVPFEQLADIQIDGSLASSYELQENDIVTVRSNGNKRLIGRCLLMGKSDQKISYSGFTIRIRLLKESIEAEFLAYYLKTPSTHELLINSGEGANISNLNQKILNALPIAYPSVSQQLQLVLSIKQVERESSQLISLAEQKLLALDELKKSILQKAFSGELTKESKGVAA